MPQALLEDEPLLAMTGPAKTGPTKTTATDTRLAKTSEGRAAEVERLIAPSLTAMGYAIVRILLAGDQRAKLQIMIERSDGAGITVEDCAAASRAAEAILDVEDPIRSAYVLEVSSPGIDRPLTRLDDFRRFAGFEARIETTMPQDGRRRFSGRLRGIAGDRVLIDSEDGPVEIGFAAIAKAKLLLTDELIAAHMRQKAAADEQPGKA